MIFSRTKVSCSVGGELKETGQRLLTAHKNTPLPCANTHTVVWFGAQQWTCWRPQLMVDQQSVIPTQPREQGVKNNQKKKSDRVFLRIRLNGISVYELYHTSRPSVLW